ncbi:MAG: DUF4920 domain-containing protein [Ignavibacteriales bacterium]|nr:DUF4920 domain-containing protein [Ignavibacteriales bacterium]
MTKRFLAVALAIVFVSVAFAEGGDKYGEEITLKEKTKISSILETPEKFVGKEVLIEGTVVGVCENRGCWIEVAGDKEFQSIRVKVEDGVIVFPIESKGKTALVQGEVFKVKVKPAAEDAHDHGEEHSCDGEGGCESGGDGCETKYQIRGIGAVIG